jgi:hypothetical protein
MKRTLEPIPNYKQHQVHSRHLQAGVPYEYQEHQQLFDIAHLKDTACSAVSALQQHMAGGGQPCTPVCHRAPLLLLSSYMSLYS